MSESVDVMIPVGQAEGTESLVSTWFKAVGDEVTENEPLLEISTDKVNMEVAAPGTGRLVEILKSDGEQIEQCEIVKAKHLDEPRRGALVLIKIKPAIELLLGKARSAADTADAVVEQRRVVTLSRESDLVA